MDTLVFDIETQNFFTDPDVGWNNFAALKISVVCVFSYARNEYTCYEESEMERLAELFHGARQLVGFSMNRYDVPVLNRYFQEFKDRDELNLWKKARYDIAEAVEGAAGGRISLNRLSQANLGIGKNGHGSKAIRLYREGRIDELKAYCLQDVRLTKGLYDRALRRGYLVVPRKETGDTVQVPMIAHL